MEIRSNAKMSKRVLTLALAIIVAIAMIVPQMGSVAYADETGVVTIASRGVGDITTGYTVEVTSVPTYTEVNEVKPYKLYTIETAGSVITLGTPSAGTFKNGVYAAGGSESNKIYSSVEYYANTNASVADVKADLSRIVYKGAGTVKITAAKYLPKTASENLTSQSSSFDDVYYNGHYYRLSYWAKTWKDAMEAIATEAKGTAAYPGYKAHPVTITTLAENKMIEDNFFSKVYKIYEDDAKTNSKDVTTNVANARIWLGAVPTVATKLGADGYVDNKCGSDKAATAGDGSSWKWMWTTPESDVALPSDSNEKDYWQDIQPSGGAQIAGVTSAQTFGVCMGIAGTNQWDDIGVGGEATVSYYVIEYSPINSETGAWVKNGSVSATTGFNQVKSTSQEFTANDVYMAKVNYKTEVLYDLPATGDYTIGVGGSTYTVASADKTIALAGTAKDGTTKYNCIGTAATSITLSDGIVSKTMSIDARIDTAVLPTTSEIKLYSTKFTITNAKANQVYSIDGGNTWTTPDSNSEVLFDKLKSSTTYTISTKIVATDSAFESYVKTVDVKTLPKYGQTSATEEENTTTKDLETAKAEAKSDVAEAASETYDTAEAAEVKAIKEQAEKDIAAATTVAEVNKIKANAQSEIAAIPTAAEKADKKAVQSVNSKKFKATSKKIKKNGKTAVKLTWNAPSGVKLDGYVIYRSTKKSTLGKKVYDTTTKTTYTNAKYLKKGNTYYYKVKGYKVINGEKVYTGWSTRAYRTIK